MVSIPRRALFLALWGVLGAAPPSTGMGLGTAGLACVAAWPQPVGHGGIPLKEGAQGSAGPGRLHRREQT